MKLALLVLRYKGRPGVVLDKYGQLIPNLRNYSSREVIYQLCTQAVRHGYFNLEKYLEDMSSNPEGLSLINENLTFVGSHFFRGEIWPKLRETCVSAFKNTSKEKIRIWCAGCSTGKEVYSILMVLLDILPPEKIEMLATDYNHEMLRRCEEGAYSISIIKEIPPVYRRYTFRYTPPKTEKTTSDFRHQFHISSQLRDMVVARRHDLLTDDYPQGFDLILCRNVIKFFTPEDKLKVQRRLASSLNEGGFLVVSDELVREAILDPDSMGLAQIDNSCIYKKL